MRSPYLIGLIMVAGLGHADDVRPGPRDKILKTFVDEFVVLTPGKGKHPESFMMGSADGPDAERPAHKVTFRYSFAIAKYEVAQELYEAIIGKNPSKWVGRRNSVEIVNWDEANDFCRKATGE